MEWGANPSGNFAPKKIARKTQERGALANCSQGLQGMATARNLSHSIMVTGPWRKMGIEENVDLTPLPERRRLRWIHQASDPSAEALESWRAGR